MTTDIKDSLAIPMVQVNDRWSPPKDIIDGVVLEPGFTVLGAISGDNTEITINSLSGKFGTKPGGGSPLHLLDAEYGDETWSPLQRFSGDLSTPLASFQDTVKPSGATGALLYEQPQAGNGYHIFGRLKTDVSQSPVTRLFTAIRLSTNWDGQDAFSTNNSWNLKGVRHTSTDNSSSFSVPLWGQSSHPNGGPRSAGFTNGGTIYHGANVFGIDRFKNQWRTWESLSLFSFDSPDTVQRVIIDGVKEDYPGNKIQLSLNNAITELSMFQHEGVGPGWSRPGDYLASSYVYVDDSWCSVIIADTFNWTDSSEHSRALCIPVSWSNNQITFILRKRMHVELSGKSLFVRTNTGNIFKVWEWL